MHTHVGYLLVRLGKRAQRAFESSLVPLGLRPPHFDVLAVLAEQGRLSQKEVAEVLGVDSAAPGFRRIRVTPSLGPLQRASGVIPHPKGLIEVRVERGGPTGLVIDVKAPAGVEVVKGA